MRSSGVSARAVAPFLLALLVLLGLLALLGAALIPAHWTSIWMDREFTGWVVPISNRFADGMRLYSDGGHTPMPPLAFVLTYLFVGGDGVWLDESILNFLCQAGILLLLYLDISKRIDVLTAFWSILCATAVIFMLPKSILYDSMAQFLVAATTVALLRGADRVAAHSEIGRDRNVLPIGARSMLLPGALIALALLTKQSTGAGVAIGCSLAIVCGYTALPFKLRLTLVTQLAVIALSVSIVCSVMLAWSGFIALPGMLVDVFVSGAEPKGGGRLLLANLSNYGTNIIEQLFPWALVAIALSAIAFWRGGVAPSTGNSRSAVQYGIIVAGGLLAVVVGWLFYHGNPVALRISAFVAPVFWDRHPLHSSPVLWTGLFVLVIYLLPVRYAAERFAGISTLRRYGLILIPAAVFHSLSVAEFRWSYDNNPLIVAAICALIVILRQLANAISAGKLALSQGLTACAGLILCLATLSGLTSQLLIASYCTESWPEVRHLQNARLRPEANGMRELVAEVRKLTATDPEAEILLLPEDPNVQAWLDRPRPQLSNAIIFADQYWDQYVDADFAKLEEHPPALIILGPRNYTRQFNQVWNGGAPWGTTRLLQKVNDELLPDQYELVAELKITFWGKDEFMDVYRRRDLNTDTPTRAAGVDDHAPAIVY